MFFSEVIVCEKEAAIIKKPHNYHIRDSDTGLAMTLLVIAHSATIYDFDLFILRSRVFLNNSIEQSLMCQLVWIPRIIDSLILESGNLVEECDSDIVRSGKKPKQQRNAYCNA